MTQADEDYQYDANGNRTGGGMVIGDNNQVTSNGIFDYEYDDEGNLVLKTEISQLRIGLRVVPHGLPRLERCRT